MKSELVKVDLGCLCSDVKFKAHKLMTFPRCPCNMNLIEYHLKENTVFERTIKPYSWKCVKPTTNNN